MRASLLTLAAVGALSLAGTASAADQDFTLRNRTGYQIDSVYLSRPSASEWGTDVMGRDSVLTDGDSTDITFREKARGCHWDMKVEYHDGDTAEWKNLNLCEISTVTLHWDRKAGTTRAETE